MVLVASGCFVASAAGTAGEVSAGGVVGGGAGVAGDVCVSCANVKPRDNVKVVRVSHEIVFIMRQVEILSRLLSMFAICQFAIVRV